MWADTYVKGEGNVISRQKKQKKKPQAEETKISIPPDGIIDPLQVGTKLLAPERHVEQNPVKLNLPYVKDSIGI